LGFSTRGIAESAVKSGYRVFTVDFFGDYDQRLLVKNISLLRDFGLPFSARNVLKAIKKRPLESDAIVYTSPFENHPREVQKIAQGRVLLGNSPESLRKVRNWKLLRSFSLNEGIPLPETIFPGEPLPQEGEWLIKPEKGGGGHGIKLWNGERLKRGFFLQKRERGTPCSVVFVADGKRSLLLGISEQLIGLPELGAGGFTWCGNISPLEKAKGETENLVCKLEEMTSKLTRAFALKGINGIDFLLSASSNTPLLLEINPRFPASVEILERAFDFPGFDFHVKGCQGQLPDFRLKERLDSEGFLGKAIVYAKRDSIVPTEVASWILRNRRDVPFPGEIIKKGHPICTVFAKGQTREECFQALLLEAEKVEEELTPCLITS
jgi:predicted ATP-grasp superfamily ATP-dependent carboligase